MTPPKFTLEKQPGGQPIPITADLTVGRAENCGLRIVEGGLSREHALLSVSEGSVWLSDLGSTNGTFVNDVRITSKVQLKPNDVVRFDEEQFLFRVHLEEQRETKTVLRHTPAPAPEKHAESGRFKPPAWVDPDRKDEAGKTRLLNEEELERLRKAGALRSADIAVDAPTLTVLGGSGDPVRHRLAVGAAGKKEWSVGSQGEREILIEREGVSALHAKLVSVGARWKLVDQMSSNGTFVNGQLARTSYLNSGDHLTFGPVECVFHFPSSGALDSAAITGGRLKKVLLIVGVAFVITLAALLLVIYRR
jgi:pSer/pThr/pTyr-binding forkhead associated (FHA) protein